MKKRRKPLLILLLLAFVGQGLVASALPCQLPLNIHSAEGAVDTTAMDHSAHHMPADTAKAADGNSSKSCCDTGVCAMSHCQLAATLPLSYLASSREFAPVFFRIHTATAPSGVQDSLYRPPISR
jgi:hypothetical protein